MHCGLHNAGRWRPTVAFCASAALLPRSPLGEAPAICPPRGAAPASRRVPKRPAAEDATTAYHPHSQT